MLTKQTFNGYFPDVVKSQFPTERLSLEWSEHALAKAVLEDFWNGPDYHLDVSEPMVVEAETNNHLALIKMVVRLPYDDERDMVLVLVRSAWQGRWYVSTCWSNHVRDHHETLRRDHIVSPPCCVAR